MRAKEYIETVMSHVHCRALAQNVNYTTQINTSEQGIAFKRSYTEPGCTTSGRDATDSAVIGAYYWQIEL